MKLISNCRRRKRRYRLQRSTMLPAHTLDCFECGQRMAVPPLYRGQQVHCPNCGYKVVKIGYSPYIMPLFYAGVSLLLLIVMCSMVFVKVTLWSVTSILSLPLIIKQLIVLDVGLWAPLVFLFTFGVPLLFLLLCIYVHTALLRNRRYPCLLGAMRMLLRLRHWLMVDVFFASAVAAYIKLSSVSEIEFGPAFYLMAALTAMLVLTSASISPHWVYHKIHCLYSRGKTTVVPESKEHVCCNNCFYFCHAAEEVCGVCGSNLHNRRPNSLHASIIFLIAAILLYVPANIMPIMISSNPTEIQISTILNGIVYVWNDGDRLIAVIIFIASIVVPVLKIMLLLMLNFSLYYGRLPLGALVMQKIYRFTVLIGKWSIVDIFVMIILMSAFDTHVARVVQGPAAVYFCLMVVLTMLSAHFFDTRLLWDKVRSFQNSLNNRSSENVPINQPEYERR